MSLINDALKKAQRQRSDPSAIPIFDDTPATPDVDNSPATPELTESTTSTPVTKPSPVGDLTRKSNPVKPQGPAPTPARSSTPQTSFKYPTAHTSPPAWKKDATPATPATPGTPSQRYQTGGSASPHARPSTAPSFKYQDPSSQKEPVSPMTLWLWLGGIALVLISIGVTLSIMNAPIDPVNPTIANVAAPKPVAKRQAAVSPPAPAPQPITSPTPTATPALDEATTPPAVVATPASPQTAAEIPAIVSLPVATPVATATPPSATPAPTTAAPAPAAALPPLYAPRPPAPVNPTARVQNFVNRLRVTGIRLSDKGTKVILGDRLFTIGEIVDTNLELRLIKAEPNVLTFADATGKTYIKIF